MIVVRVTWHTRHVPYTSRGVHVARTSCVTDDRRPDAWWCVREEGGGWGVDCVVLQRAFWERNSGLQGEKDEEGEVRGGVVRRMTTGWEGGGEGRQSMVDVR